DEEVVSDNDSGEEGSDVEFVDLETKGDSGKEESPKPSTQGLPPPTPFVRSSPKEIQGINGEIEALLPACINFDSALEGGDEVVGMNEKGEIQDGNVNMFSSVPVHTVRQGQDTARAW
ncbi:hypothetical protein U1Q18_021145, partial [Sarracenia purpurea var. burkii]